MSIHLFSYFSYFNDVLLWSLNISLSVNGASVKKIFLILPNNMKYNGSYFTLKYSQLYV